LLLRPICLKGKSYYLATRRDSNHVRLFFA